MNTYFAFDYFINNVLALGAVADFGAQNCQNSIKVGGRYNVQLTTSPAIEPNVC
jgi:hypothetical protein